MNNTGFINTISKIEKNTIVRAIRNGLINIIPVLIVGAFALILKTFPIKGYQEAIASFLGGFFLDFFNIVYSATFGVLSVYMTFSISRSYMKLKTDPNVVGGGAVITSLICFLILAGTNLEGFKLDNMGPKSMFLAIITGIGASSLYFHLFRLFLKKKRTLFTTGATREFNRMLSTFFPITLVVLAFGLLNLLVTKIFDVDSFRMLLSDLFNAMFSWQGTGFFKGFLFVLLSSILWFFGIHGSDTLEGIMQQYFAGGLELNQASIEAGGEATVVLTKEFFDCFVLMGGCGSTICLLIAILAFSKNKARRGLGYTASFPMLFNINELMVFGLPIIFNPIMLIPFLVVPLVCYSISYFAISVGLVPMITSSVEWTTPILLGGYSATGSIAGSILQLVLVVIGVSIYLPFVIIMDKQTEASAKRDYEEFMKFFKENESDFVNKKITEIGNVYGEFAKGLCVEIQHGLNRYVQMAYQPQYHYDGKCYGVESLLRFNHPIHGYLYPPLVIKLAEEGGVLAQLEEMVLEKALQDRPELLKQYGENIHLSINVTGKTIITPRYLSLCSKLNEQNSFKGKNICIEITEQAVLEFNDVTKNAFKTLRDMGLLLAIDDFSMGQTSLNYLKDNMFDIIKLDGSLITEMFDHTNVLDIVSSIVKLSKSLDMIVVAEYVQSDEQKEALHEMGCDTYQGYLYSQAIFLK